MIPNSTLQGISTKDVFDRHDADRDGQLSQQEFLNFLKSMPLGLTSNEQSQLFEFIDSDKDRRISFPEFTEGLKYHGDGEMAKSLEADQQ